MSVSLCFINVLMLLSTSVPRTFPWWDCTLNNTLIDWVITYYCVSNSVRVDPMLSGDEGRGLDFVSRSGSSLGQNTGSAWEHSQDSHYNTFWPVWVLENVVWTEKHSTDLPRLMDFVLRDRYRLFVYLNDKVVAKKWICLTLCLNTLASVALSQIQP